MTPGTFSEGDSMRPWDTLSDDEKRLFSRMAEVFAGFSEYTDGQVGRIGDDGGDAVSSEYKPKFAFTGGKIVNVVVDVADDAYGDVEREMAATMARD